MNTVRIRFRAGNFVRDVADKLRGRCCAMPRYMADGGYHFWRCGLRRGHDGPHRSGYYFWGPGGSVYDPNGPHARMADRRPTETRRQRRERNAWHALANKKRELAESAEVPDAA